MAEKVTMDVDTEIAALRREVAELKQQLGQRLHGGDHEALAAIASKVDALLSLARTRRAADRAVTQERAATCDATCDERAALAGSPELEPYPRLNLTEP